MTMMKKGLFAVMALLTVFAMIGCSSTDPDPGPGPDTGEGFVVPTDWVRFTEAEMLGAQFYIGQAEGAGYKPAGTSITKNADGSYKVTLKTTTETASRTSVVWVEFADNKVFRNGWYASLTLPTTGGNVRPVEVHVIPVQKGKKGSDGDVAWAQSQNQDVTGDLPATIVDGSGAFAGYVVGELSMHWGTEELQDTDFTGLAIWLVWAPVGVTNGVDYTFTIKDLAVLPHSGGGDPELEAWTPEPYNPAPVLTGWQDLTSPTISACYPAGITMTPNGSGGYVVTAKTRADGHTEITFKGTDIGFKGGYYLRLKMPTLTKTSTNKPKRINMRADSTWAFEVDKQKAFKWIEGEFDCYYEHETFTKRHDTIVLSIYWHEGVVAGEDYVFTINSFKVKELTNEEAPEEPVIHDSSQLSDATYTVGATVTPLKVVPAWTTNSSKYTFEWWQDTSENQSTWPATNTGITTDSFSPPTTTAGTFYYYCVVKYPAGGTRTLTRVIKIIVN